jgi:hypothetical protein
MRQRAYADLLSSKNRARFHAKVEEYKRYGGSTASNASVLVKALRVNDVDVATQIVKAQSNARMFNGLTPSGDWPLREAVEYALRSRNMHVLQLMLKRGAKPDKHVSLSTHVLQSISPTGTRVRKIPATHMRVLLLLKKSQSQSHQIHKTVWPARMQQQNTSSFKETNKSASIPGYVPFF